MKINIENLVRHCGAKSHYKYSLECFIEHLKLLKEKGDVVTLNEFF